MDASATFVMEPLEVCDTSSTKVATLRSGGAASDAMRLMGVRKGMRAKKLLCEQPAMILRIGYMIHEAIPVNSRHLGATCIESANTSSEAGYAESTAALRTSSGDKESKNFSRSQRMDNDSCPAIVATSLDQARRAPDVRADLPRVAKSKSDTLASPHSFKDGMIIILNRRYSKGVFAIGLSPPAGLGMRDIMLRSS